MAKSKRKTTKHEECECDTHDMHHGCHCHSHHGCGGCAYGLGFIGAAVYYISNATSFWIGVLGVLKAAVWPAFLVHALFKLLGM